MVEFDYSFPCCTKKDLGFYLIVDSLAWLKRMIPVGVKTFQLRIKNKAYQELKEEIKQAIVLARDSGVRLYINDYWELALEYGAYGVHLGQEDMNSADFKALLESGIYLGLSTHNQEEIERAYALRPSYLACGPVFPTTSKEMRYPAQYLAGLGKWRLAFDYPLVAIGGINLNNLPQILAVNVEGIAVISAVLQSSQPEIVAQEFIKLIDE